jgi:RyR domain
MYNVLRTPTFNDIARVAHGVIRAYNQSMGDNSLPDWESLTRDEQASRFKAVVFVAQNPQATPADQHNQWLQSRLSEGWVYGEQKDQIKKVSPALVPYEELPQRQRAKDYIFQAIVRELLRIS